MRPRRNAQIRTARLYRSRSDLVRTHDDPHGHADPDISQFCEANDNFGFTHGACVAANQTRNFVPGVADRCRDEAVQAQFGAANHGECVRIGIRLFPGGLTDVTDGVSCPRPAPRSDGRRLDLVRPSVFLPVVSPA